MRIVEQDILNVIKSKFPVSESMLASNLGSKNVRAAKGAYIALSDFFGVKPCIVKRPARPHMPSERMLRILKALVIKNKANSVGDVRERVWYDEKDKSVLYSRGIEYKLLDLNTCFESSVLLMIDNNPVTIFDNMYDAKKEVFKYESTYS